VFSVTSEAVASATFQPTPPKSARTDPSQGGDSFGALVDSSMPVDTGNATSAVQQPQQPAPQGRAGDTAPPADNTQSRDAASADQTAKSASDGRDATAKQASDANNVTLGTGPVQGSGAKFDASKAGPVKPTGKPSSDTTAAADASASAQQGGLPVTTPNPIAVAIPVTVAPTDVPATTPASGNAAAPLAIAAAAIAASSPARSATATSAAKVTIDSKAATAATASAVATAADTAPAVATANTGATAATAKAAAQAAAGVTVAAPVKQAATQTGATTATDAALTAAVATTAPVAPKTTLLKAPVAAPAKTAASAASATNSGTSDPSATATPAAPVQTNGAPQPAAAAKQQAGNDIVDTAKAEASANSAPTSTAVLSAHDHSPTAAAAHMPTDSLDIGIQPTATFQPQIPSTPATAAPVGPLSVTIAADAPVPLSGLAVQIAASAKSGKSSFDIRLDPADLGRIDVRIDVDRNGQVTSHLTVEKPETLSMLRQDAPQLQRALDDAGLKTGNGGLQFSLRDQSSSGQNNGNDTSRNAQRLVISDEDTIPAAVAGRTYGRVFGSSSGVDIRV